VKKSKKWLAIKVKDTGVGISKADLPHIFERFYQADSSRTKSKTDGFGLGLSIAKKIVEFHKGNIKVESKLGKGSTFIVKLPQG
jgi:signal transduction histidine kinase